MSWVQRLEIERPRVPLTGEVAQHAESRVRIDLERALAAVFTDQVTPVAEKDEAAAHQPSQEVAHFDQLALRRGLLANLQRARGHRFEIAGRRSHLLEHALEALGDTIGVVRTAVQAQFKMDERFGLLSGPDPFERGQAAGGVALGEEHRMQKKSGADAEVMKILEHTVDDERAVLHHRFDEAAGAIALRRDYDADLDRFGAQREKLKRVGAEP